MGCLKLTYYEKEEVHFFEGLWKKSVGSKNCVEYYPFGLTFNSYQRENLIKNKKLYNDGAEREDALELNVDGTKFRTYDASYGRWWQIDPLADDDNLVTWTPYNYSFNNPIRYNDPKGDCPPGVICEDVVDNPEISNDNGGKNVNRFINDDLGRGRRSPTREHYGIDILAQKGTPVASMMSGTVIDVRNSFEPGEYAKNSTGNYVIIRSNLPDGTFVDVKYAHLDAVNTDITNGVAIEAGQLFGESGNTGNAANIGEENHHVHIEVSTDGVFYGGHQRTDPEKYMKSEFAGDGERMWKPDDMNDL